MLLDILKPSDSPTTIGGEWVFAQDADSGAISREWVADDPSTDNIEGNSITNVKCIAKSALGSSLRSAEQFDAKYLDNDWIKISVSAMTNITMRDKVTNIRTFSGSVIWSEEESTGNLPTVFDVMRVSPVIDAFGNVVEKSVIAMRAEVQQ
jgi:hypothetical protein